MRPISEVIDGALASAKAAIDVQRAKHLLIPHTPAYDRTSIGSIAAAMMREAVAPSDPINVIKASASIRRGLKDTMDGAEKKLSDAYLQADDWVGITEHLEGSRATLPPNLEPTLQAAVSTIKRALESGMLEPREALAICAEMRRDQAVAMEQLDDARKTLSRIRSAGDVAVASDAARAFRERAGGDAMLLKMATSYEDIAIRRKAAHAQKFYEPKTATRIMKSLEHSATGVRM